MLDTRCPTEVSSSQRQPRLLQPLGSVRLCKPSLGASNALGCRERLAAPSSRLHRPRLPASSRAPYHPGSYRSFAVYKTRFSPHKKLASERRRPHDAQAPVRPPGPSCPSTGNSQLRGQISHLNFPVPSSPQGAPRGGTRLPSICYQDPRYGPRYNHGAPEGL